MSKEAKYACHIDLDEGQEPDNCVLDGGDPDFCFYAKRYGQDARNHCGEWKPITIHKKDRRDEVISDLLEALQKIQEGLSLGQDSDVLLSIASSAIKKATDE